MYFTVFGKFKELLNQRDVIFNKEEYEKYGYIFLIEDGEIKGLGVEDADRE